MYLSGYISMIFDEYLDKLMKELRDSNCRGERRQKLKAILYPFLYSASARTVRHIYQERKNDRLSS